MYACKACESPQAEVVTVHVGGHFGIERSERVNLCGRCRLKIWNPWLHVKALDGASL